MIIKKIKITESQLNAVLKKIITEEQSRIHWFDNDHNDAFDDITDEKIKEAFEEYGLRVDEIKYHPQGDAIVYFDTYELDGEFSGRLYRDLKKIGDKIGAEQTVILNDNGMVEFKFYSHLKSIS